MKRPNYILMSDLHAREDTPICRTDDYLTALLGKLDEIADLQRKFDCMVIHAGDLFDHWKPSPYLLRKIILHLPKKFVTIYGQHDLPQHNLDLSNKCGIDVLAASGSLDVLPGCHWGQEPSVKSSLFMPNHKLMLVWHNMVYNKRLPWPGCTAYSARTLLKKYPQYDLIVTGDNHKSFAVEYNGRWLVNPGSVMRMDADQVLHRPSVYFYYAEDRKVERHYLRIASDVISREHIEEKTRTQERIGAFVQRLKTDWRMKLSFRDNLEEFFGQNPVHSRIKQIVYNSIEKPKKS